MTAPADPPRPGIVSRLSAALSAALGGAHRRMADRVDPGGAQRTSILTFTIEPGAGLVVRDDGYGCPLGWTGRDFSRAHADAGQPADTATRVWLPRYAGRCWPPAGYLPLPEDPRLISWVTTQAQAGRVGEVILHDGCGG